jgi:hypothetical protein
MAKQQKISLTELKEALKNKDDSTRYNAMFDFARSDVTLEAIPTLLAALTDANPGVVSCAAVSLGRLGAEARTYGKECYGAPQVVYELRQAARQLDPLTGMPQSYDDCIAALVQIDPQHPYVLELIHNHIGLTNWYPLKASLTALKIIGNEQALDLLKRAVAFWMPELDKKQKRIVEEILAGKR